MGLLDLLDLAHPVSIRNANTDCDENREIPRFQEKRVLDVLQLDRLGDFVTSLLTSVRGGEGGGRERAHLSQMR